VAAPAKQRALGCLLVNSVCESIMWNKDIQSILKDSMNNVRKALLVRTRELEKGRALAKGLNADKAADLLQNLYVAIKVAARSGKAPKQLAEQVSFTLASLLK
jgi:TetR/AcrR family transcriptional repressor of nem operon